MMRPRIARAALVALLCAWPAWSFASSVDGPDQASSTQAGPPQVPPQAPPPGPPGSRPPGPPPALRIFLDCDECDTDYLRREVTFVEYVRDRSVADIHVLVTTQDTGGGGMAWTLKYIGLARFAGVDRTHTFTTTVTATSDDRRREFARVFKLGLVGYAADTGPASRLEVTWRRPPPALPGNMVAGTKNDPWHKWLFRTNAGANYSSEQRSTYGSYRLGFSGSRTTEGWKANVSANISHSEAVYTISPTEDVHSLSESWNTNGLLVKSLTGKWSWGSKGSISSSSYSNTERAISGSSGLEFDFFPYAEIERRSLTVQWTAGAAGYKYREITIYDKLEETVPFHQLSVSLGLRQPWGSVGASTYFTQHLNHLDRYSASMYGNADIRLFKGFSISLYGGYSKIEDQIALRKGAATQEEILLRLRQQATDYSFNYSLGFSYSFGSIFNSIVNPRFNGAGFFFF
jgi:hypothetical protein